MKKINSPNVKEGKTMVLLDSKIAKELRRLKLDFDFLSYDQAIDFLFKEYRSKK
jgi:hypothetical protein